VSRNDQIFGTSIFYPNESNLKITQRISETFSICPAQFEIISKALGKRFGIPRTFGFDVMFVKKHH
jgi:hypothetical protein